MPQARERPGSRAFKGRRPVPVDATGSDVLVEQRLGFQRSDHPAAERFAGVHLSGPLVYDFEPALLLRVRDCHLPVAGPNFVLAGLFGVPHLGGNTGTVGTVELRAKDTFRHLTGHALPGKP